MSNEQQPYEQDIEYLKNNNILNKLKPPTENSEDAFAERIALALADVANNQSVGILRQTIYSYYLLGNVGDMPEAIK